ncbi:MAG: HD-GYP domain-containing protein [Nitrospirae bacterium]|nr:HD-GYP domain-containing protein [Nitrospirota bacterium]
MIKRVPVSQLKPGMFIDDLNCNWIDHPFFSAKFKIGSLGDIQKINKLGIKEVSIDTSKGLDVASAPSDEKVKSEVDAKFKEQVRDLDEPVREVALAKEILIAKSVRNEAKQVIKDVLDDVRLGRQIEVDKVEQVVSKITDSIFRNKDALIGLSRIKHMNEYLFLHSVSVCVLMISFSNAVGLKREQINEVGVGALLHDIGKVKVHANILNKPGRLTEEEFASMKEHVSLGRKLLTETSRLSETALLVSYQHHERFDGTGYPNKLKGNEISIYGQMAAIVDVFDAITSDRCYHKGMESAVALKKIFEWSKFHFNPALVQHFIRCVGIYPIGTLVRLDNEHLAVVIESGKENLTKPKVRVIYNLKHRSFTKPLDIDLSGPGANRTIISSESPSDYDINPFQYTDIFFN